MINFRSYSNITKVVIPSSIQLSNTSFYNAFNTRTYLKTAELNHSSIVNMSSAFYNCRNLTTASLPTKNVTNMYRMCYQCINLTSSPVCGDKVTSMYNAYYNCQKMTGSPACGNNVQNISSAYYNCKSLTGKPVCGENVTNMAYAYRNCSGLNQVFNIESKVTNIAYAFYGCSGLPAGDYYFKSNNIANLEYCFQGKNFSRRYNIHIPNNSTMITKYTNKSSGYSITGSAMTWTNNAGKEYYNTTYNIYLYPDL